MSELPTMRLQQFLAQWCDADADPADVRLALTAAPSASFARWLQSDLSKALLADALTLRLLERLTGLEFDDDDDVDRWLREMWQSWFPGVPWPTR